MLNLKSMEKLDSRLGRMASLESKDFDNLLSELPKRAKEVNNSILTLFKDLEYFYEIRKEKAKSSSDLITKNIENMSDKIEKGILSGVDLESAKYHRMKLMELQTEIFKSENEFSKIFVVMIEDYAAIYGPAKRPFEPVSMHIDSKKYDITQIFSYFNAFMGMAPLPVGYLSVPISILLTYIGSKKALRGLKNYYDKVKLIIAFEWYLDFLKNEELIKIEAVINKRKCEISYFDELLDPLESKILKFLSDLKLENVTN
jgi:hypothetical protein